MLFISIQPCMLGLKLTNELSLLGEIVSTQYAFDIKLVNRVVPNTEIMEILARIAEKLIKPSMFALQTIKETSSGILRNNLHHFWVSCKKFQGKSLGPMIFWKAPLLLLKKISAFIGH